MNKQTKEMLANYAHSAWAGWMDYLFRQSILNMDGTVTIPKSLVDRWKRQCETAYKDLPESEQSSDMDEADRILDIIEGG